MPDTAEIELKLETEPGFVLPDLSGLPGVASVAPPQVSQLEATYVDTPDLRLAAHRHTLRRRTGGHDAGWHLRYDPQMTVAHEDRVHPLAWYRRRVAYNASVAPLLSHSRAPMPMAPPPKVEFDAAGGGDEGGGVAGGGSWA